jgi:HK97 gp10 family phage protein
MSYSMTIDTKAVKRWAAKVDSTAAGEVQKYLNLALKNSATIVMQREMKEAPRGVTGKLAKSISQLVTSIAAVIGPDHSLDYPIFVEKGTKPHMPPIDAITPWALAKGLNPWAVAMGIKKRGTKANPFVERTFKGSKAEVIVEFQTTAKLITEFLAKA